MTDDERKAYHRKYYLANREKYLERSREARVKHPERVKEYNRKACEENKEKKAEYNREYRNTRLTSEKSAAYSRKVKYGITQDQYDELLVMQDHRCAVCRKHEDDLKMRLAVDHNHKTGEIRGLLCTYCNHRIIGNHTDGEKLRRMAAYVERHTGWFVPDKKKKKKT